MGRCVLKLDHYCLWIANAVGLLNYKFFLLFLIYSTLACLEAAAALAPVAVHMLVDGGDSGSAGVILFATIFCFAFAVALIAFLGMHWDMLAKNYTSIESIDHEVAASWQFDRGLKRNLTEVFGRRCVLPAS
jgi:palmitoyltransferase ZDHHC2/15/20